MIPAGPISPCPVAPALQRGFSAEKLTRRYQKHSDLPIPLIQPEGAPHDEWELDAQGRMHVAGVGNVSVITSIDVVSRLASVESYPCLDTTNPPLEAYQLMLRRAFVTTGSATAHHVGSRHGLLREHLALALSDALASVAPR